MDFDQEKTELILSKVQASLRGEHLSELPGGIGR
jgi:hypothetical protein